MAKRSPKCDIISGQIAKLIDNAQRDGAEFQQTTRIGREAGDGGIWQYDVLYPHEFGAPVAPLQKGEWISTLGYVSTQGEEPGQQLAGIIQRHQLLTDVRSRRDLQFLKRDIGAVRKEEHVHLLEVLEQRDRTLDDNGAYKNLPGSQVILPANERVARAARAIEGYFEARANLAEQRTLEGFTRRRNYAPEMYKTDTLRSQAFQTKAREKLALDVAKQNGRSTAIAQDYATAASLFENHISPNYAQVAANVQKLRFLDIGEGRITDPLEYMSLYAQQYWKAINSDDILGRRGTPTGRPLLVDQLLGQIEQQFPGNNRLRSAATALVDDTIGFTPSDPFLNGWIVRSLGSLQTLKLTLSTIKNATQLVNSAYYNGFRSTLKAVGQLVGNTEVEMGIPAREFAGMMASVLGNSLYEASLFQNQGRIGQVGQQLLKYNGFTGTEIINRSVSGVAGALNATLQASQFVKTGKKHYANQLVELGLNPEKIRAQGGLLTLEDKLVAGQRSIDVTQGRARLSDLPVFTATNQSWGRLLLTFKTFSVNQAKMMVEGSQRNPIRTTVFGLGVMPLVGMGVNFLYDRGLEELGVPQPKYKEEEDPVARYLEGMASAGSYGLFSDIFYHSYLGSGQSQFKGVLTPPILGTLEDTFYAAGHAMRAVAAGDEETRDQNLSQLQHTVLRQFGGLGAAFVRYQKEQN